MSGFAGGSEGHGFVPEDRACAGSLSQRFAFQANGDPERYRFMRRQDEIDVYCDTVTGREVYAGRTPQVP